MGESGGEERWVRRRRGKRENADGLMFCWGGKLEGGRKENKGLTNVTF